jgi:hypothetical protein
MKADALIRFMLLGNRSWEEFTILLARISLGAFLRKQALRCRSHPGDVRILPKIRDKSG